MADAAAVGGEVRLIAAGQCVIEFAEQAGLLARKVWPEVPPRVEYRLTPKGESLVPLLEQLLDWAAKNA